MHSSYIVKDLISKDGYTTGEEGLAYFYCNREESERNTPHSIMRTLLRQLAQPGGTEALLPPVVQEYEAEKKRGFSSGPLGLKKCGELAIEILSTGIYKGVTIIVDALDECDSENRRQLFDILKNIALKFSTVKVFVSSRRDTDIMRYFDGVQSVSIEAADNQDDIRRFVETKVALSIKTEKLLGGIVTPEVVGQITKTLIKGASGM